MNKTNTMHGNTIVAQQVIQDIQPVIYKGHRVLTSKAIAAIHGLEDCAVIRNNFKNNREYFKEGTHFFKLTAKEAVQAGLPRARDASEYKFHTLRFFGAAPSGLVLFTEAGYLKLCKSLTDKLAWDVQDMLINAYFLTKEAVANVPEASPSVPAMDLQNILAPLEGILTKVFEAHREEMRMERAGFLNIINGLQDKLQTLAAPQVDYTKHRTALEGMNKFDFPFKQVGWLTSHTGEVGMMLSAISRHFDYPIHERGGATANRYHPEVLRALLAGFASTGESILADLAKLQKRAQIIMARTELR